MKPASATTMPLPIQIAGAFRSHPCRHQFA
jgi:hypothetical protein